MATAQKDKKKGGVGIVIVLILLALLVTAAILLGRQWFSDLFAPKIETAVGYVASPDETVPIYDAKGTELGTYVRGMEVTYVAEAPREDGMVRLPVEDGFVYMEAEHITDDPNAVVTREEIYVLRTVNLLDETGAVLGDLVEKGDKLTVMGFDGLQEDGSVSRYLVTNGTDAGYIAVDYIALSDEEAQTQWDEKLYTLHVSRGNKYGGGDAADLDYFPFPKGDFTDNVMPDEVRALYLNGSAIQYPDTYLSIADNCGINAFVVDIMDGGAIAYASPVMQKYSPTAYADAFDTMENFRANVQKLKNAGYYLIARITAFNDANLAVDHPEYCLADLSGNALKIDSAYWPSAFCRQVWEYKAELALEAAELGFNEVQFDYVRFPNGAWKYEKAGTIDMRNTYGESKAQAVQRFLMYAATRLHAANCYISADVFGECAQDYVTAYGQYWPAISAVVDAISGMPYPDHYGASGDYLPWEHPYETLYAYGTQAMERQSETASPAAVRTWIQAYNAIREPYNTYGPTEVGAEIRALREAGCTGGFMTWNGGSSVDKYRYLMPAFN